MVAIFGERKIFWKLPTVHFLDTLWVKNFDKIALSRTVKEIEANLCFSSFGPKVHRLDTLWVENFDEITLSRMVKEIEANLCFSIFDKNLKIQMVAIFGERKIFWKLPIVHFLDTLWVKNFDEIALSHTVKEIEANLCFSIFGKNLKIQNGRHFWWEENFLKIAKSTLIRYPVDQKFRRNRSILHG